MFCSGLGRCEQSLYQHLQEGPHRGECDFSKVQQELKVRPLFGEGWERSTLGAVDWYSCNVTILFVSVVTCEHALVY